MIVIICSSVEIHTTYIVYFKVPYSIDRVEGVIQISSQR